MIAARNPALSLLEAEVTRLTRSEEKWSCHE